MTRRKYWDSNPDCSGSAQQWELSSQQPKVLTRLTTIFPNQINSHTRNRTEITHSSEGRDTTTLCDH